MKIIPKFLFIIAIAGCCSEGWAQKFEFAAIYQLNSGQSKYRQFMVIKEDSSILYLSYLNSTQEFDSFSNEKIVCINDKKILFEEMKDSITSIPIAYWLQGKKLYNVVTEDTTFSTVNQQFENCSEFLRKDFHISRSKQNYYRKISKRRARRKYGIAYEEL